MNNVTEIKRGAVAKHFWPDYTGVATAIDEALVKLESRGNITLPADYKRAFVQWDTLEEVRGGIIVHLNWVAINSSLAPELYNTDVSLVRAFAFSLRTLIGKLSK